MNVQVKTQRRGVPSGHGGPRRVLVVDDDRDFAAGLAEHLGLNGYEAETANDAALALDRAEAVRPGVALVDIALGRDSGLDLVARIKERHPETICVMITAHATVDTAIEAVKQGAYDYLRKPLVEGEVLLALERSFEKLDLEREKAAAEAALMASEERFRDFTEAASDWVWELDQDLRFTFVSERIRELTGIAPEDILGKTRWQVAGADPDRDEAWRRHRADLEARRPFRDFEYGYENRRGHSGYRRVSGKPIFDEAGAFKGYRGTGADVTARVEAERRAQQAHERLLDALESMNDGFVLFGSDDRLVVCNSRYKELYPGISDICVPGVTLEELVRAAISGNMLLDAESNPEKWIAARLKQYRTAEGTLEQRLAGGRWVLASERKTSEGGTVGIRTDITALKQAESKLREREARISGVLDNIADGVVTIDETGAIESLNPAAERIFGYDPGELVGRAVTNLMPGPHRRRHASHLRDYLATGESKIIGKGPRELEARRKDGTAFPISLAVSEMRLGDRRLFIGAIRDITQHKRAEEALRASEAQMRLITDALPVLIGYVDADARYRFVNAACEAWYARPRAEILGRHVRDILGEEGYGQIRTHLENPDDGAPKTMEREMSYPDGSTRHVRVTGVPRIGPDGRAEGHVMLVADISEAKHAEQALRESEARFRAITETSPVSIVITRISDGAFLFCNDQFSELIKLPAEEVLRRKATEFYSDPRDRERVVAAMRDGGARNVEMRFRTADGEVVWVMFSSQLMEFEGERVVLSAIMDISAQKRVEAELRESERRAAEAHAFLVDAIESSPDGIAIYDADDKLAMFNDKFRTGVLSGIGDLIVPGVGYEDLLRAAIGRGLVDILDGDVEEYLRARIDHHRGGEGSLEVKLADNRWMLSRERRMAGGGIVGTRRDITQMKRAEEALRESEERFRAVVDNSPVAILLKDLKGRFQIINRQFETWHNISADEAVGKTSHDVYPKDLADRLFALDRGVLERDEVLTDESDVPFADGTVHRIVVTKFAVRDSGGRTIGVGSVSDDVTERRRAEDAVRKSEEQLRLITDSLPVLIGYMDAEEHYRFLNKPAEKWHRRPAEELIGKTLKEVLPREMYKLNRPRFEKVLSGELVQFEDEVAFPGGGVRQVQGSYIPHFGEGGHVVGFFALGENVTRQRAMEAQLRQAQKMEAVGQLTGGVAHDFNNLLTIVLGNLELLGEDIAEKSEQIALLAPARDAALRGADLTQRLLAFSRKQTLQPKTVELNQLVFGMVDMLRRTLGENIEIRTVTAGRPWKTRVDPGQVENAILNLAINARDAMPEGGSLVVETANAVIDEAAAADHAHARPGKYVALSITDTGIGMTPEILEHALEPFFTTKDIGRGTGLGLSMIYGFVRQSGGHVRIASEEGRGTTVTLYIPKAPAPRKKAPDSGPAGRQKAPGGDETILLVEDDPPVRKLAVKILRGLGYSVLEAATGKAALEILDATPVIDLLLTDVMLPEGMSGWDVAEEAPRRRSGIKVLYMSGHADDVLAPHGGLPEGRSLLKKPFRKLDLARTVRRVLDDARNEP